LLSVRPGPSYLEFETGARDPLRQTEQPHGSSQYRLILHSKIKRGSMPIAPTDPNANDTITITMSKPEQPTTKPPSPPKPRKKDTKLSTTAEGVGAGENKMEPTIEKTLEVMQSVYELLHEKVLRAEQKNDACNKMAWATEQIKTICFLKIPEEKVNPIDTSTTVIALEERSHSIDNADMNSIANDIKDIKAALEEALASRAGTWTQSVARA